jgi:hypothetical protein
MDVRVWMNCYLGFSSWFLWKLESDTPAWVLLKIEVVRRKAQSEMPQEVHGGDWVCFCCVGGTCHPAQSTLRAEPKHVDHDTEPE